MHIPDSLLWRRFFKLDPSSIVFPSAPNSIFTHFKFFRALDFNNHKARTRNKNNEISFTFSDITILGKSPMHTRHNNPIIRKLIFECLQHLVFPTVCRQTTHNFRHLSYSFSLILTATKEKSKASLEETKPSLVLSLGAFIPCLYETLTEISLPVGLAANHSSPSPS